MRHPKWITESLFTDPVRRHFKRQNHVTKFSSAAECDGSDKMVSILMTPTSWGCDPTVRKAYIEDAIPQCRSMPVTVVFGFSQMRGVKTGVAWLRK